jgi:hypothetical protein
VGPWAGSVWVRTASAAACSSSGPQLTQLCRTRGIRIGPNLETSTLEDRSGLRASGSPSRRSGPCSVLKDDRHPARARRARSQACDREGGGAARQTSVCSSSSASPSTPGRSSWAAGPKSCSVTGAETKNPTHSANLALTKPQSPAGIFESPKF